MKLLDKTQKGFTLIELMIAVAIIGILMAIAIQTITYGMARAKASEVINLLKGVTTAVLIYHQEHDRFPNSLTDIDPSSSSIKLSGKYVQDIEWKSDNGNDFSINVIFRPTAVWDAEGKWLRNMEGSVMGAAPRPTMAIAGGGSPCVICVYNATTRQFTINKTCG
jgi:prepilin-type N-terminal cleavage/methylation domain-containing protein